MKMQEVITRLRELAPEAAAASQLALAEFQALGDLLVDLRACVADASRAAILDLVDAKRLSILKRLSVADDATGRLQELNEAYKEKLGPRAKKSGDDPRQPELPGIAEWRPDSSSCSGDCSPTCPRGKTSSVACEYCDNGVCRGVVYPTNPPQYDPCVFCPETNARQ